MDNDSKKRKRAENWDSSQKILLRQLIEEKVSVIENKCVDTNTTKSKKEAWTEILTHFNSISQVKRDLKQLQLQWKTLKMKAREKQSEYRRIRNATGGGPPPKSPDPEEQKLYSLIPHEFEVDDNIYDSDYLNSKIQKENVSPVGEETPAKAETKSLITPLVNANQSAKEVESLEDEVSAPCHLTATPKKKEPKKNMQDDDLKNQLYEASMENKRIEKKNMEEEHGLRMRLLMEQIKQVEQERNQSEELFEIRKKKFKNDEFCVL